MVCYYEAPSLTRGRVAAGPRQRSPELRGAHDQILFSQIWDFPNFEGLVTVLNTVAQLYPYTYPYL
jgi:hypothetical protein